MRICFFNRSYYPDMGATGRLLTELAEDLVRHYGCQVSVVTGPAMVDGDGLGPRAWAPVGRETRNGVNVFRARATKFPPRRFAGRATNYLSYFLSACIAGLRVPRPDVVVALTDPPIIGLAALLTARLSRAGFVFVCQDVFPEVASLLEDFRSERLNTILDRINRFLLRKADRIIALGETMRKRLVAGKGADPSKVTVIHNWADCSSIAPGEKRNPFSLAHGIADSFVVMHSGNVGLSQNLDTLLEAAYRLRHCPDIVIAVVGDGVRREALEARARAEGLDHARFLPYQPKDRLRDSFASADVFVVSLKAGLAGYIVPSKLYGILAAGRPYVAAVEKESEVAAITEKYACGLLANPGDPDDLAEKILILYHNRALARRLGENARQAALEFDRPLQVRTYYELFHEVTRFRSPGPQPRTSFLKRPIDAFLSALGLFLSAPIWVLLAFCIKLQDGGPAFYAQERVGKGGRGFKSWKFRSMVTDSDARFGPLQATDGDPRVTQVGRLLRATALDELPQLWNIFKGDMSFVGPRALLREEIEVNGKGEVIPLEKIPGYEERHKVSPGLTGLAQVYAPRDIPRRQKFRYDLLYVKRQSFWLDIKLILLSVWISVRGKWEARSRKF